LWDATQEWIEMRLQARRVVTVQVPALGMTVQYTQGEQMRTEVSTKFRRAGLGAELLAAGFADQLWWTDPDERFALVLAEAS
jgi:L-histidine Nalpha-methyltransferase